jgi:protein phosphatase
VLLLGGGAYGAWWYNQQQYYVGVQDGYVAVFQGTNQSLAGMSLSKLLTTSTLKVSQLGLTDQNSLTQTISKSSVGDATTLIDGLQTQANVCHNQWTALAAWQAKSVSYNAAVAKDKASKAKPKPTVPASEAPGPQPPAPDPDNCAPASAFGIPASALPGSQPVAPATTPTVKPSVTPTPTATAKKPATSAAG